MGCVLNIHLELTLAWVVYCQPIWILSNTGSSKHRSAAYMSAWNSNIPPLEVVVALLIAGQDDAGAQVSSPATHCPPGRRNVAYTQ